MLMQPKRLADLPGVSVTRSGGEATKVVLRGLSDKYTAVTLDGVRIPSTDALDRGIGFKYNFTKLHLPELNYIKALKSDKDADAIGGSINLGDKKSSGS